MYPEGKSPTKEVVGLWRCTGWVAYERCAPGRVFYYLSDLANCGCRGVRPPMFSKAAQGQSIRTEKIKDMVSAQEQLLCGARSWECVGDLQSRLPLCHAGCISRGALPEGHLCPAPHTPELAYWSPSDFLLYLLPLQGHSWQF